MTLTLSFRVSVLGFVVIFGSTKVDLLQSFFLISSRNRGNSTPKDTYSK